jgi:transcriptional regulator with XRE-family HTH domain
MSSRESKDIETPLAEPKMITFVVQVTRRGLPLAADGTTIFANRMRALRLSRNLSQSELAEKLRSVDGLLVDRSLVSKWETSSHNPGIGALELIARFFEVTVDYLTGKSEVEKAESQKPKVPEGLEGDLTLRWLTREQIELLEMVEQLKGEGRHLLRALIIAQNEGLSGLLKDEKRRRIRGPNKKKSEKGNKPGMESHAEEEDL